MPTTTALGPRSAQIYYTPGETIASLYDSIQGVLFGFGWELWDAQGGTNSARVYRCINADGVTYKYVRVELVASTGAGVPGYMNLGLYENWNATTHVGENVAHLSDTFAAAATVGYTHGPWGQGNALAMVYGTAQRFDLTASGYIYLYGTQRYLCAFSRYGSMVGDATFGSATGVFEVRREAAGDTPANDDVNGPPVIWTNLAYAMGRGMVLNGTTGPQHTSNITASTYSVTRYRAMTGYNASRFLSVATLIGRSIPYGVGERSYSGALWQHIPNTMVNGLNYVFAMYATNAGNSPYLFGGFVRGQIYGPKVITRGQGITFDTINIRTSADMLLDETGGTETTHIVFADNADTRVVLPA